jgi:hypothetical protein
MYILIFFSLLFFFSGIYLIIADIAKIPLVQTSKGIVILSRSQKPKSINIHLDNIASWLSKYIKLNEYKKKKLVAELKAANINKTPEKHIASVIVKSGIPIVLGIPFLFIFPIAFPILAILGVRKFFLEINLPKKKAERTKSAIERELPRFCREIEQNLKSTRDVLFILENYKKNAGEIFKREIEITIADMKTGNYENALTRWEARIQSSMLSDIIKGLIAVIRGDNSVMYFQMLSHDFKQLEIQELKREAVKRPGKIRKYSGMMLGCMILMYVVVFVIAILQGTRELFG